MTIREYFAAPGAQFSNEQANIIGPELYRLYNQGRSTAPEIVEAARPKAAPLHPFFEWQDSKAAELYRQQQAMNMANHIRYVERIGDREEPTRAFHAVRRVVTEVAPEDEAQATVREPRFYVPMDVVKEVPDYAAQVIERAMENLMAWRNRHRQYRQLLGEPFQPVFEAIDQLEEVREEATI